MADGIKVNEGSGPVASTEEITNLNGGVVSAQHGQRVIPSVRTADGTAVDVTSSAPLPVDDDATQVLLTAIKALLEGTAVVKVTDNAGSLTIDAPLGTPVGVRLSDGSEAIGTTSKRLHVDDGGSSLSVDDNGGSLTVDGTVAVSSLPSLVLSAGTAAIGKLAANSGVDIGDVDVTSLPALPAGNNNIGDVDIASISAGSNTIGKVGLTPQTTGGLTIKRVLAAATTNATSVKASAGQVFGWFISNKASTAKFVKFYNKASAPTVGTDTPVMTIEIPKEAASNIEWVNGIAFGTGIALAITGAVADADTTAVSANDVIVNLFYA